MDLTSSVIPAAWARRRPLARRGSRTGQRGSTLVFILIAIALLAGLTVLLSRTGSQSEDTGSTEQGRIAASQFLNYMASIETALQTLKMQGCSETQFSFHNDYDKDGDYFDNEGCCGDRGALNPTSPANLSCHVFAPAGAGITYISANKKGWTTGVFPFPYGSWFFSAWNRVTLNNKAGVQYTGITVTTNFVSQDLCLGINRLMGISNPSGMPPVGTGNVGGAGFSGTFTAAFAPYTTSGGEINQKKAGCFRRNQADDNVAFYVLYMR